MLNAIVTGAYGAIGSAICQGLVDKGYDLTLVGRDEARLMNLQQKLGTRVAGGRVDYHVVDLSLKASIVSFACSWNKPLNLLINAAGIVLLSLHALEVLFFNGSLRGRSHRWFDRLQILLTGIFHVMSIPRPQEASSHA